MALVLCVCARVFVCTDMCRHVVISTTLGPVCHSVPRPWSTIRTPTRWRLTLTPSTSMGPSVYPAALVSTCVCVCLSILHLSNCACKALGTFFSSSPAHFVVDGSSCVNGCPREKKEVERKGQRQCEPCSGLCPKGNTHTYECHNLSVVGVSIEYFRNTKSHKLPNKQIESLAVPCSLWGYRRGKQRNGWLQ